MKKKCKVVMLSTNEKANISMSLMNILLIGGSHPENNQYKNQHLYIVSDDEIKEGDWYLTSDNKILQCEKVLMNLIYAKNDYGRNPNGCKKIIATTDSSLKTGQLCGTCDDGTMVDSTKRFGTKDCGCITTLPQLSQQFIEYFISEYNMKDNVITEVMVEFDCDHSQMPNKVIDILKLNQDNTINIDVVKDSWTRDEVITLVKNVVGESHDWSKENNDIHSIGIIDKKFLNKWIEKNL